LLRGLGGAQMEINLATLVYNLKRMLNILGGIKSDRRLPPKGTSVEWFCAKCKDQSRATRFGSYGNCVFASHSDMEEEFTFMKEDLKRVKAVIREKLGVSLD
jgi:hypothetical protein